jgi:hypothetical protein
MPRRGFSGSKKPDRGSTLQKAQEIAARIRQQKPSGRLKPSMRMAGTSRQKEEELFFESFRVLGLPMCATTEQLAKIKHPKPLPECVVAQVKD